MLKILFIKKLKKLMILKKKKIIGNLFIKIFEKYSKKISKLNF